MLSGRHIFPAETMDTFSTYPFLPGDDSLLFDNSVSGNLLPLPTAHSTPVGTMNRSMPDRIQTVFVPSPPINSDKTIKNFSGYVHKHIKSFKESES